MDPPALAAGQVEQGKLAWGDSWSLLGRGALAGQGQASLTPLPAKPGLSFTSTHPVIHVLLGGGGQTHRPPLPGPLGGVQGEGVLGLIQHGHQHGHLIEEHVDVLFTEGGGRGCHQGTVAPWG